MEADDLALSRWEGGEPRCDAGGEKRGGNRGPRPSLGDEPLEPQSLPLVDPCRAARDT